MTDYEANFIYPAGSDKYTGTALPDRTPIAETRFKHDDFKTCINGTLKINSYHVEVYIHTGRKNTVIPSTDNVSIYIYTENRFGRSFIREDDEDSGLREGTYKLYADMQAAVLQEIESRVMDNLEYLDDLREF